MKKLFLILLTVCTSVLSAQPYEEIIYGDIPQSDLAMTAWPYDSEAEAVVLADQGLMRVDSDNQGRYESMLRRHKRIKILTPVGVEKYGDATLYYYHKDNLESITQLKAQSISPDGKIEEVPEKEMFREKINENWTKITFSFPNVQVGSVVEYRYHHYSYLITTPDEWAFRDEIPVRSSYYHFACKAPITYSFLMLGAEYMNKTQQADGTTVFSLGNMTVRANNGSFWMQNGDAVHLEPFMTTPEDYLIKIRFQASEYVTYTGTKVKVYDTWEATAKDLLNDDHLGLFFTKERNYKKIVEAASNAIPATLPASEKLNLIADFITTQDSLEWR
ncbi:MAG: DUF3857 domain-containing protein [Saprospiraceae bacterium]